MATIKVPADTTKLKNLGFAALDKILNKKPGEPEKKEDDLSRRTKSRIREEQEKNKNLNMTLEEVKAQLAAKEQELETFKTEAEEAKKKVAEYEPDATAFSKMKRKTIAEIIAKLPQEKQAKAKVMADKLGLEDFKEWASGYGGLGQQEQPTGGKGTDFAALIAKNDSKALDEAIAANPAAWNKFQDESLKK